MPTRTDFTGTTPNSSCYFRQITTGGGTIETPSETSRALCAQQIQVAKCSTHGSGKPYKRAIHASGT